MKVGIVIPDGTGIRNYLYSDVVSELKKNNVEIILYHSISKEAINEIVKLHNYNFKVVVLPVFRESVLQKFYREVICFARLKYNSNQVKNPTILKHWTPRKRNFKNKLFYNIVEFLGNQIYKKYDKILTYEQKYDDAILKSSTKHISILKDTQPDILFSTHQRSMNAVPLIKAAKTIGIKNVGAIFSWDNLPKARLTVRTDKYIVWSQHMFKQLNRFYPEIDNSDIQLTGTPQFEFYFKDELLISREEFFEVHNLDITKKTLCFSGDDEFTSPFDPKFLEDIAETIVMHKLNIQIILRRAPVDLSGRFDYLVDKYPTIIKPIAPIWITKSADKTQWQTIFPLYKDVQLLINTVKHSDAVINLGSTMALDFAMYKKPAIYVNYDHVKSVDWNVEMIYNFQHFRSMEGLNPVLWVNSKNDIKIVLETAFESKPSLDNDEWLSRIAEDREHASKNIAKYLISCI